MKALFCIPLLLLAMYPLHGQSPEIKLTQGLVIRQSVRIKTSVYPLSASAVQVFQDSTDLAAVQPVIVISGENITVDFQQAVLRGAPENTLPNTFYGVAIQVKGKNIILKNATARGYKVALLAEGVSGLVLENCDFSYNYRPKLNSERAREDETDWLSYHHNEHNEWMRYGAGIYLKNCTGATVKACHITGNQNALLMHGCRESTVYNNVFQFNSGVGIGMYRCSNNRIMHNRLDWNVRGYSHGFYQRGQDSAGILLYEQSSNNLIAYNSATHSGDGLFLWAGQSTMDSGQGGCNDNFIFGNDFSAAPTNGIEVTFSRNRIQGNYITDCTYGIWGGYSYESVITGNLITGCKTAIAIEHGQNDTIRQNYIRDDSTGIQLWANAKQPADWGYAQKRDTRSRDGLIDHNVFLGVRKPLKISASENMAVNGENLFFNFETLLESQIPNKGLKFWRNDVYASSAALEKTWAHPELTAQRKLNFDHPDKTPDDPYAPLMIPYVQLKEPDSLPGGINTALQVQYPQPREFILMEPWGPYDFLRPMVHLKEIKAGPNGTQLYVFRILGPAGAWVLRTHTGFEKPVIESGQTPSLLTLVRDTSVPSMYLNFDFLGKTPITTVFGEKIPAETPFQFEYENKAPR
ncbi:MAG: right-handed parallel beta-helix repeat-containing protein [Saprospiraceae bacterium]|nr:right-handed parallel beta-helix repeat-containing protein [Saprospiraceae bacterium]